MKDKIMTQTFTRKKAVIVPQLKLVDDQPVFVKATSEIYQGKEIKDAQGKTSQADIMDIVNLETGECMQLLVGTIAKETLIEGYPEGSYVGKSFELTRHGKAEGKRYKTYSLFELDVEETAPATKAK